MLPRFLCICYDRRMNISQKPVVIVSGASRGIGRAIAVKFLQEEYMVVGLYKTSHHAATLVRKLGVDMQQADVSIEADVIKALEYIRHAYGRIDVVVNNAGINIFGDIDSYTLPNWNTMLATNLTSVFLLSKYSTPLLKRGSNSNIINISSRRGASAYVEPGFIAYSASKAAINAFTLGLAKELGTSGIRVNAVIPTPTKTDLFDETFTAEEEVVMREEGVLGSTDEVAQLVVDIVNNKSLNGQLIVDTRVTQ